MMVDSAGAELARSDCLETELTTCSLSSPSRSEMSSARAGPEVSAASTAAASVTTNRLLK